MSETTPETGALSFEQAVESLIPQQQEDALAEAAPEAAAPAEGEEEPQGETSAPEEAAEGAENPEAEEEGAEEERAETPLDPPLYWKPEAKEAFAKLPPELQAVVLEQEGPREEAAAKAKQEAAEVRQKADHDIKQVQAIADALNERLPQWLETFKSRWGDNPDWTAHAQNVGFEQMTLDKLAYEQERAQLEEAQKARQAAQTQAFQAYVQSEFARLAEMEPELAPDPKDPRQGAEKRAEVSRYLQGLGVEAEAINGISAVEMSIARKAMLWDQAQKALKSAPPKPPAAKPRPAVKPAAAAQQTSQQRTAQQVANRFAQTRTVDDAVALLLAKR